MGVGGCGSVGDWEGVSDGGGVENESGQKTKNIENLQLFTPK